MDMNNGLAATAMPPQQQQSAPTGGMPPQGGADPTSTVSPEIIADVVKLLLQGTSPQELMNSGIPPEVIEEAIAVLESQEESAAMTASPPTGPSPEELMGQGLASKMV